MPHLALSAIVKSFGPARALDGAALDLRGGEVHALMGENGAGKSTLIRILAGLEVADVGTVQLDGATLTLGSTDAARRAGFRFLHQELQVVPGLEVAENMHLSMPYPRRLGLVHWRDLRARARAALARLGVDHIDPRRPMADLGPGDQMLVRIAATLLPTAQAEPWAYVLDEPTASLTGAEAARLFAAIAELKAQGAGILYVSHRMDEVMALADRITVLRDGRHIATRNRADTTRDQIIHDMTGREMADLFPPHVPARTAALLSVRDLVADGLRGVNLDLAEGEILGLAGLSGAGRGAALRALMGDLRHQGTVTLGDRILQGGPDAAWASGIAYVPRERRSQGVMLRRALAETIALPHLATLSRRGFLRHRATTELVARLSAEVRLKAGSPAQPVAELSGGNQQKVLFARALAGRPRVLLLDEPTRGVDVGAKFDIYSLIRRLAAEGTGVIVASSDLVELIGLCTRIAVMDRGRISRILPAAGLTEAALLAACYERTD